jgi:hypothetical protein
MYITGIWCLMGGGCRLAYVKSLMDLKDLTSERAVALLVLTAQNNAHTITSTPHGQRPAHMMLMRSAHVCLCGGS